MASFRPSSNSKLSLSSKLHRIKSRVEPLPEFKGTAQQWRILSAQRAAFGKLNLCVQRLAGPFLEGSLSSGLFEPAEPLLVWSKVPRRPDEMAVVIRRRGKQSAFFPTLPQWELSHVVLPLLLPKLLCGVPS